MTLSVSHNDAGEFWPTLLHNICLSDDILAVLVVVECIVWGTEDQDAPLVQQMLLIYLLLHLNTITIVTILFSFDFF